MLKSHIRLFESSISEASLVSFDRYISTAPVMGQEALASYFDKHGQTMTKVETPSQAAHLDADFYEITPPLAEAQIGRLAVICLGLADNGKNRVLFVDNRQQVPARHTQEAGPVVAWI